MKRKEEDLLKKALGEQLEGELSKIPADHEIYALHSFSESFLQRMRELLPEEGKCENKSHKIPFRRWSALAAACLVLVVGLSLLPMITRRNTAGEGDMAARPQEAPMAAENADSIKGEQDNAVAWEDSAAAPAAAEEAAPAVAQESVGTEVTGGTEAAGLPFTPEDIKTITIRWWDGEAQTEVVRTTADEDLIREFCTLAEDSHLEFSQLANQALYPAEMSCLQAELKEGGIWETYSREESFKELIP